jgi:small subunit ribosomal protein S20
MSNHQSAKKQNRQAIAQAARNRAALSRIKTFTKKVLAAVELGDASTAVSLFRTAEAEIMRGVKKGILKLNNAARKISKLSKKVKSLQLD